MAPVFTLLLGLVAVNGVLGHPGHSVAEEAAERAAFMKRSPNSVRSCATLLSRRGHIEKALSRRRNMVSLARAKRGLADNVPMLSRRDFADYNFTHASNKSVSLGSDETLLYTDDSSCLLQAEVTQGPYYVDGELIRPDIVESQEGVPLYIDLQLVDTSTCEPVPALFVDFWHCNATGVYSGVIANGNGNSNDTSNLDETFLRGIQQSDANGVVQIETIFPGHYTGRATHIHILAHNTNDTIVRTNGTVLGSNHTAQASHVGQLFFDQSLISEVNGLYPYSSNTQTTTLNADDDILASEAENSDPFVEYVLLGDSVSEGIMAWISVGIDPTTDDAITSTATVYKDGGVANSESGSGMPGGGSGGPNSTTPSGVLSGSALPTMSTSA